MTSMLIVNHGGSKNDTLVTLEYKVEEPCKQITLSEAYPQESEDKEWMI